MIPPCLTLCNIRYVFRVKWSNTGKGVAPAPTPWCSCYWKESLWVTLNYGRQLTITFYDAAVQYFSHYIMETLPSDGETPVLKIWVVKSIPSLPLFPGPLAPAMVVLFKVSSMGWKDLFKNHSYLIGPYKKTMKKYIKFVNMKIKWIKFSNLLV